MSDGVRPAAATDGPPSTDGLAVATRGVHKRYGDRVALAGLDLSVPSGVIYGFLGPNGAGKTTTMRLLTGLIHPDAGRIDILGRPFGRRDRHRLFDVGALIESPAFYPYLSGRDNLRVLAATGAPVPSGRIDELLGLLGLADRATDAVSGYSLGMRQRLGIAAALLNDPRLLLLDEPANGLDPAGIVAMRDTLRYLASTGKTVLVSSHILGEIQQLADVVGIVAAGRLIREGPIGELLASEGYVTVRVGAGEAEAAESIIAGAIGSTPTAVVRGAAGGPDQVETAWLRVAGGLDDAARINRALAGAGIFASGLDTGSDLESFFLELTTDAATGGSASAGPSSGATPATELPGDWGTRP